MYHVSNMGVKNVFTHDYLGNEIGWTDYVVEEWCGDLSGKRTDGQLVKER